MKIALGYIRNNNTRLFTTPYMRCYNRVISNQYRQALKGSYNTILKEINNLVKETREREKTPYTESLSLLLGARGEAEKEEEPPPPSTESSSRSRAETATRSGDNTS